MWVRVAKLGQYSLFGLLILAKLGEYPLFGNYENGHYC